MNRKIKKIIANTVIIALILIGSGWIASIFIHPGVEFTNNAQINRDIVPVSSRVQGFIQDIRFDDFQYVEKGDTLVLIEDSEYQLRLAQAEANYRNSMVGKNVTGTSVSAANNNLYVTDAGINEVEIQLYNAQSEYIRYKTLLENGAVTRQQFDAIETTHKSLQAKLETMKHQKQSTTLAKVEQIQRLEQRDEDITLSEAALNLAQLNLSYTIVLAPCSGFVSRKTIQEGELVMPGKNLFSIISDDEIWVIANYRETQRKNIKEGSKVEVKVDAFPNTPFEGVVTSISNATGSAYSATSPDRSAGNFVKTEQRIPVKIHFTNENDRQLIAQLVSGMNVSCKIKK